MIRKGDEQSITINKNMRGGNGNIRIEAILNPNEMYDKGRLFSKIIIKPGCSIGYHIHENEMEAFYVLSGRGDYDDNGVKTVIMAGDSTMTSSGEGHAVENNGDEDLEMIALILFK